MKKLLYLFAIAVITFSCKKDKTLQEDAIDAEISMSTKTKLAPEHLPGDSIIQLDSTKFPKRPKDLNRVAAADIFSDLYQLNGMNFFIQTKDSYFGKNSLQSQGKGKEVILAPFSSSNGNQLFYLRFLPASSGIPYLIYSTNEGTPIGAGSYATNLVTKGITIKVNKD
jgi:hypothetical protein